MHRVMLCVAATLLAACTSTSGTAPSGSTVLEANARMVRVVDGDTIVAHVDGREERVRLIGIDTPESVKPSAGGGTEPAECFGHAAAAHTRSLLPDGVPLRLERDVEARDDYDRVLAYVHRASDGLFVNLELVRSGHATVLTFPPNVTHAREFVAAARDARAAGRGLWSACSAPVASRP